MKLSKAQAKALSLLGQGPNSAYAMQVSLATLFALQKRKLVTPVGLGHIAFPHNGTWQITKAGRELQETLGS